MTRAHLKWHPAPGRPSRYAATEKGGRPVQLIGGTVPWFGLSGTVSFMKGICPSGSAAKPWGHMTVSLPPATELTPAKWEEAMAVVLDALGLPPRQIPWIGWQHMVGATGGVDHCHVVLLPETFGGRVLV